MAIYQMTDQELVPVSATSFSAENIHERGHIQQMLKANIGVLDDSLMVIAEEFGEWVDSSRRIDLLCLDTEANLVVVELKRTEDGGHMELQAIRYAAMVSEMTFDQLVEAHTRYRSPAQPDTDEARAAILDFLGWSDADVDQFGQDTRIILASANFSKELTTAVLWLRDRDIDIRCVRLQPYRMADGPVLLDVQQLIPLPETADFQTQIGVKRQSERRTRTERHDIRYRFWEGLLSYARERTPLHANRRPTQDSWISGAIGRSGFSLSYVIRKTESQVELWISHGRGQAQRNKEAFRQLEAQKSQIDADFGEPLEWMELPESDGCRIRHVVDGGWRSPVEQWPEIYERLVSAMIRLDAAMRGPVAALQL